MSLPALPLSTPSLLFPAISLLMLAFTNRFLGLAAVVRNLHANWQSTQEPMLL
ncbi:MAG: II family cellulose-binding protein, partial [Chthoniobacter sp. 12-60-6]